MGRKPSKPKDPACAAAEIMAAKSGLNARAELGQSLRLQTRGLLLWSRETSLGRPEFLPIRKRFSQIMRNIGRKASLLRGLALQA